MLKIKIIHFIFSLILGIPAFGQYSAQLLKTHVERYYLIVNKVLGSDSIVLKKQMNYQVFKLCQADIDNSGQDEFITGAIKRTKFDTTVSKRINIWKIEDNAIVPMWLGSKMSHPLYDFEIKADSCGHVICTIELEKDGLYLIAKYKWHSFGLKFIAYIKREINLNEAYLTLNNEL